MSDKISVRLGRFINCPAHVVKKLFRRRLGIGRFEGNSESMHYRRGPGLEEHVHIRDIIEWRHVSEMAVDDIVLRTVNGAVLVWDDRNGEIRKHLLICVPDKKCVDED